MALALPEDMLREFSSTQDAVPFNTVRAAPSPAGVDGVMDMLGKTKRPLMIVGGGGWTQAAADDIEAFAKANDLPVACSFRRLDIMDHMGQNFVGDLSTAPAA